LKDVKVQKGRVRDGVMSRKMLANNAVVGTNDGPSKVDALNWIVNDIWTVLCSHHSNPTLRIIITLLAQ
jgi:hypothetical protein